MGAIKRAFKKVVNKLTGADDAKDAMKDYQRMLEAQKQYDPSKILQNTTVAKADEGGAREDLTQSTVQGSGGNTESVVSVDDSSSSALDRYFKKKTNNKLGSVNF